MDAHPSDSSSHCTGISDFCLHLAACPAVAHWRLPQLVPPAARSSQRIPASFGRLPLPRKRGSAPKRLFYRFISLRHCLGTACNCSDCACHSLAMPIFSVSPQSTWSLPHACESSGVNLTRMYGVNGLCRASTFTSATSSARAEPFAVARLMGVSLVRRLVAFAVFSMLSLMRSCSLPVSTTQRNLQLLANEYCWSCSLGRSMIYNDCMLCHLLHHCICFSSNFSCGVLLSKTFKNSIEPSPSLVGFVWARLHLIPDMVMPMAVSLTGRHVIQLDGLCVFCAGLFTVCIFDVSLVMRSKSCCPERPAPRSAVLSLSASLAAMVGLRTLGSWFAFSCGGLCAGNGGSCGGACDPAGVVVNKLCNFSLASAARLLIAVFGMGVAPAFALADPFGVANISSWISPGPSSSSSILRFGAFCLFNLSMNSPTRSWSWTLSSAACSSCLLRSSLISLITVCSSFLKSSIPFLAYSAVSSTIFLQSASRFVLTSEYLLSYWLVMWETFWFALCLASSATVFFSLAFASLTSLLKF